MQINKASVSDYFQIKQRISEFELDNRGMQQEQFLSAKYNNSLVGFGRIRPYAACSELCSLGVIPSERLKGVGKQLVQSLIRTSQKPLYVVCIIPEFFEPFEFKITKNYPKELQEKLEYCIQELVVRESYVVMKYLKI